MIDNERIRTGFDVEVLLGAAWIRTALQGLADAGALLPDDLPAPFADADVEVDAVTIVHDVAGRDLRVNLTLNGTIPIELLASLELSDDGTELIIDTNVPNVGTTVPFNLAGDLGGLPALERVRGNDEYQDAIGIYLNLDLRASPQQQEPLPPDQHVPRGQVILRQSFLPAGQDIAIGIGQATFPRLANHAWHTSLRATDGTHPFPGEDDQQGEFTVVSISPRNGFIRVTLGAVVPVDSPLIDIVPDAQITIEIDAQPKLDGETLQFEVTVSDTDVDLGLLGDLVAAVGGFLFGLIVGLGSPVAGAVFAAQFVLILEFNEFAQEGEVRRKVTARFEGDEVQVREACNEDDILVEVVDEDDGHPGILDGLTSTIPQSVVIHTDRPDPLFRRRVHIDTAYQELHMNASGLSLAGRAVPIERFEALPAGLVDRTRGDGAAFFAGLRTLIYHVDDFPEEGDELDVELGLDEVLARIPEDKLATVCLEPTNIRRQKTVITDVRFTTGLDLHIPEAVALQDNRVVRLKGLQLIHPRDANPYFRSPPDSSLENNFEELPPF
jgi:hypothetical protein